MAAILASIVPQLSGRLAEAFGYKMRDCKRFSVSSDPQTFFICFLFKEQYGNMQYSLYGLVEHSGSLHGGHYVAHVKVKPSSADSKSKWYYVSDTQVSEAQQETVLRKQAYLLFYEKVLK